ASASAGFEELFRTTRSWGLECDLQDLLDLIARESAELFRFERGAVILIEEKGLNLRSIWSAPDIPDINREHITTIASGVIKSGLPVFSPLEIIFGSGSPGFIFGIPLTGSQGILGALLLETSDTRRKLEKQEQDLLKIMGEQAASAVQHSILYHSAITDPLTNLFSHRHFQLQVEQALSQAHRSKQCLSLLVIDLDGFQEINSRFGQEAGNKCLVMTGNILKNTFRSSDLIARFGADEFEVILPDTSLAGLQSAADKLRKHIESADFPEIGKITVCLGGAVYPDNATSAQNLFIEAYNAAGAAKKEGGNCFRYSGQEAALLPPDPELRRENRDTPSSIQDVRNSGEVIRQFKEVSDPGRDFEDGEQAESFHVLKHLGRGSLGEVLLVYQPELDREVVLKRPASPHPSRKETEQFEREAKITASLNHPGIIPVYSMGRDPEGRLYYTMKPLEGSPLRSILDGRREEYTAFLHEYTLSRLIEIMFKVSETLSYAHGHNVAHLDLTPEHIFIGEFGEVSVTGWGLSPDRTEDFSGENSSLKAISYKGPEFFSTGPEPGPSSDVFAAGAILYEMAAGNLPYIKKSISESIEAIQKGNLTASEVTALETAIDPLLSKLCIDALNGDPEKRPTMKEFAESLGRFIRGEEEWEVIRFSKEGKPIDPDEWICIDGEWNFKQGEFISKGDLNSFLIWNTPCPGPYRLICEGWAEENGELALIGNGPDPDDPYKELFEGYCFQFGAETNTCTKLARNGYDVLARPGLTLEPRRKYRIEIEYYKGWLHCCVDSKQIFSYRELFPLSGKHIGIYGFGSGTHIRPLELHHLAAGSSLPAMQVANDLYKHNHFREALERYSDIAEAEEHRLKTDEARLKAGMCQNMLGKKNKAREMYKVIRKNALEPFARASDALLDLDRQGDSDPAQGIQALKLLLAEYPGHQAISMIIPPAFSARHYNIHLNPDLSLEEECRFKAELLKIGADSLKPPAQTQIRCQVYSAFYRFFSGEWEQAFTDILSLRNLLNPEQISLNNFEETLMAAALANGREDILPDSPYSLDYWDTCQIARWYPHFLFHLIIRKYDRKRFVEETLSDNTNFNSEAWDEWERFNRTLFLSYTVLSSYLADNRTDEASSFIDEVLITAGDVPFKREYLHLPILFWAGISLIESGSEELFSKWIDYCGCFTRGAYEFKTRAQGIITYLQTRFLVEQGKINEAASYLTGKQIPLISQRPTIEPILILQTMFSSLGLMNTPSNSEIRKQQKYNLAGTDLDLCRIFMGEKEPEPGPLWPHPLWRPELRLWLALWLEAKGEKEKAREVILPCVDERYGSSYCQPAITALLSRIG
ncbi:diguanylate cyclase domain-containing protein, partial [Planctomycetota bacterium]